jgi:hypothetical protein
LKGFNPLLIFSLVSSASKAPIKIRIKTIIIEVMSLVNTRREKATVATLACGRFLFTKLLPAIESFLISH